MKAAVSTDSGMVAGHFGRCPQFTLAEIKGGKILSKKVISNPGHVTGFLPKFFYEKGVEVVIAGDAGLKAKELFEEYGIKLVAGVTGRVEDVLQAFAEGRLKSGESICQPGRGKGYGIKKEDGHEE